MKVSIVTITYNAEQWLERTMLSVLAQTTTDYEYLVIDGASKDRTMEIVRRFESQFGGRLRYISEPDKGLYDAMNKGLKLAQGDYVWFVNAGDEIYSPDTLLHVVNAAVDSVDIVYGKSCVVDAQGNKVGEHHKITPKNLTKRSLLNGLVVSHQAILVRRSIANFYDLQYHISADYDWVVDAVCHSRQNVYIDEYVCKFLTSGLSAKKRKRSWLERFAIMRKYFGLLQTLWAHFIIALKYPFSTKY